MGLEQVIDDIREDAEQRAEAEREEILAEADDEAEAERQRIVANAQLKAKKQRLNAESDVLSSIRSRVESRLANLDEDERRGLIESYIEASGADELGEGAKAWGRGEDREILEGLGFTFEGEIDCIGGAVLEGPEGAIREDLRFDEVLDEIWREEIHEVAADLLEN